MFIKTTVFKHLLKQAYKRDLLQVGHEDNTNIYYIIGGYWAIMVEKRFFTNAAKAALVELIRDLPKNESIKIYSDGTRQQLIDDSTWFTLALREPEEYLEKTNLLVEEEKFGVLSRLFSAGEKLIPVNEGLCSLIDEEAKTSDDLDIIGPYKTTLSGHMLMWKNNTSTVGLLPRVWNDDEELMEQLKELEQLKRFGGKQDEHERKNTGMEES